MKKSPAPLKTFITKGCCDVVKPDTEPLRLQDAILAGLKGADTQSISTLFYTNSHLSILYFSCAQSKQGLWRQKTRQINSLHLRMQCIRVLQNLVGQHPKPFNNFREIGYAPVVLIFIVSIDSYVPGLNLYPQTWQTFTGLPLPKNPHTIEYPRLIVAIAVAPHLGHLGIFLSSSALGM